MKNDIHRYIGTYVKVTGIIVIFLSASLILPRIADAAGNLNNSPSCSHVVLKKSLNEQKQTYSDLQASCEYEPPNFGRPDSQYGSGTR